MLVLIPERYFPLPIIKEALYSLTQVTDAEIGLPEAGVIPVTLGPMVAAWSDDRLLARLYRELTDCSVSHQAFEDHRSLREALTRAALSVSDANGDALNQLKSELHGSIRRLHPWGSGECPVNQREHLARVRQLPDALQAVIAEECNQVLVTANIEAYPWPMVLRAISYVQPWARAAVLPVPGEQVKVCLEAERGVNLRELRDWYVRELQVTDEVQPALYLPVHQLNVSPVPGDQDEAGRQADADPVPVGDSPVQISIPKAVHTQDAIHLALLTLSQEVEGEIVGDDEAFIQVSLNPVARGVSSSQAVRLFRRELLVADVHRYTRMRDADLIGLFTSSADLIRPEAQAHIRRLASLEDVSPHEVPAQTPPDPMNGSYRVLGMNNDGSSVWLELNAGIHTVPALIALAQRFCNRTRVQISPGRFSHRCDIRSEKPGVAEEVLVDFLAALPTDTRSLSTTSGT